MTGFGSSHERLDFSGAVRLLESSLVRVVFGAGSLGELGAAAANEGFRKCLLVTDPGIVAAGHVGRAESSLTRAGVSVIRFDGAAENPTTAHVDAGVAVARAARVDSIIAVGGGSAMDCAKGINLLATNGGRIADYWGVNKAVRPLMPLIAVPTTAGTGSEAQSFALISDEATHQKMACGDRRSPKEGGLRPRVSILDPELTKSAPRLVAAAAGMDAAAHAVETAVTSARNAESLRFSVEAWRLLSAGFPRVVLDAGDDDARAAMLLGAHLAGAAIERSMLGAAHACANPLTARHGLIHGAAVGLMLPHVVRFNAGQDAMMYSPLVASAKELADQLTEWLVVANLPVSLRAAGVVDPAFASLAHGAMQQWTLEFNPRKATEKDIADLYEAAA